MMIIVIVESAEAPKGDNIAIAPARALSTELLASINMSNIRKGKTIRLLQLPTCDGSLSMLLSIFFVDHPLAAQGQGLGF